VSHFKEEILMILLQIMLQNILQIELFFMVKIYLFWYFFLKNLLM